MLPIRQSEPHLKRKRRRRCKKMTNEKIKNSDILFVYDAKMCNPNGDPDDENRPRMDYERETNLVSDVRLKRYIRDWLEEKGDSIFVAKVDGETVDATQRLAYWVAESLKEEDPKKAEEIFEKVKEGKITDKDFTKYINPDSILDAFIDVRLFGATMPIKSEERGQSFTFTGPVQFNWGYSLNKVALVESSTISSTFAGRTREEGEEYGTFGKDYRVYYSLIAFSGIISAKRAEHTHLTPDDIKLLEEALIKAIPFSATRSKIGQYPRLLVRVEYNDPEFFIGDLRRYIECEPKDGLRDINELELKINKLFGQLKTYHKKITKIWYWQDKELKPEFKEMAEKEGELKDKLEELKYDRESSNL
jgi:CRISPR-associated protein Csh2